MEKELTILQIQKIEVEIEKEKNKLHMIYFLLNDKKNLKIINNLESKYKFYRLINNNKIHKNLINKLKSY